jgi:MscS family membrane protein
MAERDYSRAGRYFEAKADVRRLTEELQSVLDQSGAIDPFVSLSNDPQEIWRTVSGPTSNG